MKSNIELRDSVMVCKNLIPCEMPTKATPGSAAYDLYAAKIILDTANDCLVIDTGISTSFDKSMVMLIFARSGLAVKHGIRLVNSVGVIDSDYRGPIKVILESRRLSGKALMDIISVGDRIAQAVFMPVITTELIQVVRDELDNDETNRRGEGGFGSTGT